MRSNQTITYRYALPLGVPVPVPLALSEVLGVLLDAP